MTPDPSPEPVPQADGETHWRTRATGEADRTAWRRPPGVSAGTWRYAHEGTIASRYDAFVATTPLCRLDLELVSQTFAGPSGEPNEPGGQENTVSNPPVNTDDGTAENTRAMPEKNWILDLGCGTGRASQILAEAGYGVLAIDLSLPMLREVTRRNVRGIVPLQANLVQLGCLADQTAAGAVCLFSTLGMIQGRSNRREFLRHVRRIVRPGGSFLLHVHHRYAALAHSAGRRQLIRSRLQAWWRRDVEFGDAVYPYRGLPDMFLHQFSKRELAADLSESGWVVRRWERLSIDGSKWGSRREIAGGFLVVVS